MIGCHGEDPALLSLDQLSVDHDDGVSLGMSGSQCVLDV